CEGSELLEFCRFLQLRWFLQLHLVRANGHLLADVADSLQVNLRKHKARAGICFLGNDFTPRIDYQGMSKSLAVARMRPLLGSGHYPRLRLDGASPQKHMPMRSPRRTGERSRHRDQLCPMFGHPRKQFREP